MDAIIGLDVDLPGVGAGRRCGLVVTRSRAEQALGRRMKDGHVAEARVRRIEGIGIELRFEWNGDLGVSQVFKA